MGKMSIKKIRELLDKNLKDPKGVWKLKDGKLEQNDPRELTEEDLQMMYTQGYGLTKEQQENARKAIDS